MLAVLVPVLTGATAGTSSGGTIAAESYGQYSLMFQRSAAQYWAGGAAAGQWAWTPRSATTSDISRGDPKAWPPKSAERFIHSGVWVHLAGYNDGAGRPLTQVQRVTSEKIGNVNYAGDDRDPVCGRTTALCELRRHGQRPQPRHRHSAPHRKHRRRSPTQRPQTHRPLQALNAC